MQVNPPSSVLSATNLAIILALLVATSAATFWISAERYAKEQLQEIENLRLEAEAREVRPVTKQEQHTHLHAEALTDMGKRKHGILPLFPGLTAPDNSSPIRSTSACSIITRILEGPTTD